MTEADLLDDKATCRLIGGTRPIHPATLWRGVNSGRYPQPIKIGANSNRWLRSEVEAAIQRLANERDGGRAA